MAKQRKGPSADEILKQMYPDLQTSDDAAEAAAAAAKAKETPDPNATISALQREIAELNGKISTIGTPRAKQVTDAAPQRPVIDYGLAPDPSVDPKGYAAFVSQGVKAEIEYEKAAFAYQSRSERSAATRTDTLWKDFEKQYGDYAKQTDRVEIAAERVLKRQAAAGIDVNDYMYSQSGAFMKDIVAEIDGLWGKQKGSADDDDDDGDDEELRTNGFTGGAPASSSAVRQAAPPPQKYGDLSQDIVAWQEKTGFHR